MTLGYPCPNMAAARKPFCPRADAVILTTAAKAKALPVIPSGMGPILDEEGHQKPVSPWSEQVESDYYPSKSHEYALSPAPDVPKCMPERYLRAFLAKNEVLRTSMVWYYTSNMLEDTELMCSLQEKACLAQESTGWEYVVIGILDLSFFMRIVTIGLPLGMFSRGEAIASHTVTRPPGSLFMLPNLKEDWRFRDSPLVECGGLRAYAGAPLRLQDESGEYVGLGSLCVASSSVRETPTSHQQNTLLHLADWIVADIVQAARARRQRARRRMTELITLAERELNDSENASEKPVLRILQTTFPDAAVSIQSAKGPHITVEGRESVLIADLDAGDGVWEDLDHQDEFVAKSNHKDFPNDRVVRMLYARCDSVSGPSILIVARKDFRLVIDDIDTWFVQTCAKMLSEMWHRHLLAEAMAAKENFLRGITHQLRTPIHGILGSVELLAEELKSPSLPQTFTIATALLESNSSARNEDEGGEHSVYIETIKAAARDLIYIVNSMITLNRWADIAKEEREYAMHTIDELEEELAKFVASAVGGDNRYEASLFCRNNIDPRSTFRIDLKLLRDSLAPLLLNAIHNTKKGVVTLTASLRQQSAAYELVLDIEDTGQGIRLEDQQRIFQPYEKVDKDSHRAGLGLTLATKFAALLNGEVTLVASEVDRGSHFRASFSDIECLIPVPSQAQLITKLSHLPPTFHIRQHESRERSRLTDCFADFLTHHAADSTPATPIETQEQVVICPIPATEARLTTPSISNNVVYVTGPFTTAKLAQALEHAASLFEQLSRPTINENCPPSPVSLSSLSLGRNDSAPRPSKPPAQTSIPEEASLPKDDAASIAHITQPKPQNPANTTIPTPAASEADVSNPIFPPIGTVPKPTVLVVDDNAINLRVLTIYCKKRQLPFFSVVNGQEAVELFTKHQTTLTPGTAPIQLVLMDLQMPVCDGIEATRRIRVLEREMAWSMTKLFIVTGQDNATDREAAENAGADDYYVKPLGMKVLDGAVKKHFPAFVV